MARTGAVGFSIGNKGYIGTGCTELNSSVTTYVKDFWEYDPVADTWTQKADFGGGFTNAAAGFSIGNKGYVGTGSHITYTDGNVVQTGIKEFWQYDPATDTWTQKADFGGSERELAKGFSIGDKGYIGWGQNSGYSSLKDFWEYNPATDTWTRKADTDVALNAPSAFSIGNKGYVGTGGTDGNSETINFWEYDPASDIWTKKADVGGEARGGAVGFAIGNKGYIGTGLLIQETNGQVTLTLLKDFWEYDSNSITLTPTANRYSLCPHYLWLPVTIRANAVNSDGLPVRLSAQVTCNESARQGWDWTKPVINQKTGTIVLLLRAAPSRSATDRTYTITITGTDTAGNSTAETVTIVVPRSCR